MSLREGGTVMQDERAAGGHDERRYEQGTNGTPRLSRDESKSKVAQVEGWEPFERIDRSDLDDH